ncbi:MAG TPA: hypothetical protein VFQ74_00495 [Pseudolysinimonas sp.]|nr:hypothetical protein [Pseudolysinimonas sp.]
MSTLELATRLLRPLEPLFLRLDRVGGGRIAGRRVDLAAHPKTRRGFDGILWILAAEIVVGLAAIVIAIVLTVNGMPQPWAVWFRGIAVLAITATLLYFAGRASLGWFWAYSRLRLFSRIFPVVTLVIAAIPGLYPLWMTIEQIVFSLLLIGVGDILTGNAMREAFPRPVKPEAAVNSEGA